MTDEVKDQEAQDADTGGTEVAGADTSFTQDQVDALITKRLERERAKFAKQYEGFDDLKAKAAKWDKKEQADKSELEKMQEKLAEADRQRVAAENTARERLIKTDILLAAQRLNFVNPEHAWSLVDLAAITVSDDGKVLGVEDALKALAETSGYLVGKGRAPDIDAAKGSGQRTTPIKLTADEAAAAEQLNMTPEKYAAMKTARNLTDYQKLQK